ncbi:lipoprotein LpqH [Mycolicibacterium moriokaense]|nr:lipoprotein LpqH [Mycolicibacterium moriokaense]
MRQATEAIVVIAALSTCLVGCSSSSSQPTHASAPSAGVTRVGGTSAGRARVGLASAPNSDTVAAGGAHVTVNGQSYDFATLVTCKKAAGYGQHWVMGAFAPSATPAAFEVDKTPDGKSIQLVSIIFGGQIWGAGGSSAHVRNEGNSYTVTGTAINAITNVSASFEIDATCP